MVKLYVILDIRVEVVMSYKCYNCGKKFDEDIESCDKCGANLTLDDEKCPYCNAINPDAIEHIRQLKLYQAKYATTNKKIKHKELGKNAKKLQVITVFFLLAVILELAYLISLCLPNTL